MKGVLVKNLYIARSNILVTIVSLVVLGFGLSFLLETSALLVLAPVAATTAAFISITSDAASKWNMNVITMPVSRNQIIGKKFLFYILLAVLGLFTALIPCVVGFSCKGEYPSGFQYCVYHFCYLVFYLVPGCGKGISEAGY